MRQRHSPEQITAITAQAPAQKVHVVVREVPYEQLDPVQRESWNWLWGRLLSEPGPEMTKAPGAPKTPEATADCPTKSKEKVRRT